MHCRQLGLCFTHPRDTQCRAPRHVNFHYTITSFFLLPCVPGHMYILQNDWCVSEILMRLDVLNVPWPFSLPAHPPPPRGGWGDLVKMRSGLQRT